MIDISSVRFDDTGLIPGVIQDDRTLRVLMVGWLNETALRRTLESGLVHFWSRSRNELWRKGETSGNLLHVSSLDLDCDRDTALIGVHPDGPTCHRETTACFDSPEGSPTLQGFAWLEVLWRVIASRAAQRPPGSYTTDLIAGGPDLVGRKVLEEAGEVLVAAKNHAVAGPGEQRDEASRLAEEAADLTYHLLVLLAERDLPPAAMLDTLAARSAGDRKE